MNTYCKSAFNQINIAIKKIYEIINQLEEQDLQKRPSLDKHSIGELLEHIAFICRADLHIANGATQDEMKNLYLSVSYETLTDIKNGLIINFKALEQAYCSYSEEELQEEITSFWGVTYTRYEWLLEILAHVYHHRGQLHAMLVHCYGKDPGISMFE
ncbi:DinB family protein [Niallia taxi]|uniref:DinB family protein n=1 Tax=Niallia taxi TaxID=2499688 RepID=UPI002E2224DD|nr:DinB family protein [Niallia taxi]